MIAAATVAYGHESLGAMDTALRMTTDYLTTRKQFGMTLNRFQALTFRAADMYTSLELTRSIVTWATMVLADDDTSAEKKREAASRAKLQVSTAGRHIGQEAIQLHGGIAHDRGVRRRPPHRPPHRDRPPARRRPPAGQEPLAPADRRTTWSSRCPDKSSPGASSGVSREGATALVERAVRRSHGDVLSRLERSGDRPAGRPGDVSPATHTGAAGGVGHRPGHARARPRHGPGPRGPRGGRPRRTRRRSGRPRPRPACSSRRERGLSTCRT